MIFFLSDIKPKNLLLFYFSGHGIMDKYGRCYLAPSDIDSTTDINIRKKGFSFDELENIIEDTASREVVIILDCCYSGALELKDPAANAAKPIKKIAPGRGNGKYILSACLSYQEAERIMHRKCSVFTDYLIKGLNGDDEKSIDRDGNVTPSILANYTCNKIKKHKPDEERPKQSPIFTASFSGEVILANYPNKARQGFKIRRIAQKLISKVPISIKKGLLKIKELAD